MRVSGTPTVRSSSPTASSRSTIVIDDDVSQYFESGAHSRLPVAEPGHSLEAAVERHRSPSLNEPLVKHSEFYLEDDHVTFQVIVPLHGAFHMLILLAQVRSTLFRVHSYFFSRESEESRRLLELSVDHPRGFCVIDGVQPKDMECFLRVLYCKCDRLS
jgi:hypothetical protein